jgi:hypothetical protein
MEFIFASTDFLAARIKLYFSMFSACYSLRTFVELCHGLLVLFNGRTQNKDTVINLSGHVSGGESNMNLLDYVMGKVTFGKAQKNLLYNKIQQDILSKFASKSTKNYANWKADDQLAIMRHLVITMFLMYKGNVIVTEKRSHPSRPKSAVRQALTDPLVSPTTAAAHTRSPQESADSSLERPGLLPQIQVTLPTFLDEVSAGRRF